MLLIQVLAIKEEEEIFQLRVLRKIVGSIKRTAILRPHTDHARWRWVLKELRPALFEKSSLNFQARRLQLESIFSILNHPYSFMAYYYLFGVYLY